jgi:UbiD family decarboxylase
MKPLRCTSDFVDVLREKNEIVDILDEVDPYLEIAEIQRRMVEKKGPALLFHNIKGTKFKMATNLYGSESRIRIAFGNKPIDFVKRLADFAKNAIPPKPSKIWEYRDIAFAIYKLGLKRSYNPPIFQNKIFPIDTKELPQLVSWPLDGGAFVTLPLVYTESLKTNKSNLGMYRVQFHSKDTVGMHIQIHRGGGFHYHEAEQIGESLPCHIVVGGPPGLTIAAVAPLPEEIPETVLASLLAGEKIRTSRNPKLSALPFFSDADFTMVGSIPPNIRMPEGPFGDHYGYYALKHDYPVVKVTGIYFRKNAIWPATVVGRPPQEDHYIAEFLQDLLSPVFPIVMPQVKSIWAYEESGVHSLASCIVKERYPKEAFMGALRILGEGQLSLTKCLLVTDQEISLKNFRETFITILERFDPKSDLHILSNISQDTLDYSSPKINSGSKMILLGVGEKKWNLNEKYSTSLQTQFQDSRFKNPRFYLPGILLVEVSNYTKDDGIPNLILKEKAIQNCLFVILINDASDAVKSDHDFIWYVFTRFEPAGDIFSNFTIDRNQVIQNPPIVIDARLKTWFPPITESDSATVNRVDQKFGHLFIKK